MKLLLSLFLFLGMLSCSSVSVPEKIDPETGDDSSAVVSNCIKCDYEMINYAAENWDKLDQVELEKFLCTYDESCSWPADLMETRENQKFGVAWDMLFNLFNLYFDEYLEIFETNEFISKDYLLKLFAEPAIYDLPHQEILMKLKIIEIKTEFQLQLETAFSKAISEGQKMLDDFKED